MVMTIPATIAFAGVSEPPAGTASDVTDDFRSNRKVLLCASSVLESRTATAEWCVSRRGFGLVTTTSGAGAAIPLSPFTRDCHHATCFFKSLKYFRSSSFFADISFPAFAPRLLITEGAWL